VKEKKKEAISVRLRPCDVSRLRRRVVLQREYYGRRGNLTVVLTCSVVLLWDDEKMISLSLSLSSAGVRPGVTVHRTMPLRACAVQCSSLFQRAHAHMSTEGQCPRCTSAEQPIRGTSCMHVHNTITELSLSFGSTGNPGHLGRDVNTHARLSSSSTQ
jgi:hypothetical protein